MEPTQAQAAEKPATAAPNPGEDDKQPKGLEGASLEDLDAVQTSAAEIKATSKPAGSEEKKEAQPAKPEESAQPAEAAVPAEEPAKPAEEPVTTEEPVKPAEPVNPQAPAVEESERFRFKDPKDKAIVALRKARPELSWSEAEKLVVGEPKQAPVALPDPVATLEASVSSLKAEVAQLEVTVNPPGDDDERLQTKAEREAGVKLAAKQAELKVAELELKAEKANVTRAIQSERDRQKVARDKSKALAINDYPDAADDEKPLGAAVAKRFEEMKNPQHPDHELLFTDNAPLRVTQIVAGELGIAPKSKTPQAAKPADTKIPAQPKATPVSGNKTAVPATTAGAAPGGAKFGSVQELLEKGSLEELDLVQGAGEGLAAAVR